MGSFIRRCFVLLNLFGLCSPGRAVMEGIEGPYFGHKPPGTEPEAFKLPPFPDQRGLGVFGDGGSEFFYTASDAAWYWSRIMAVRMREDGTWTEPDVVSFSGTEIDWGVFLSPDGRTVFFGSGRPIRPPDQAAWSLNVWMAERTEQGWSAAIKLPVNSDAASDYASPCALDGNLYWSRFPGGIYRSSYIDGQYTSPRQIYELGQAGRPFISPDESFLLLRVGSTSMISLRNADDTWTAPRDLGPKINEKGGDWPALSPDGKYLFFCGSGYQNLYWMDVRAVLPDPNGLIYNLSTGQRFASIQTAANYAQSGEVILVSPGTYKQNLTLPNTPLTIRSANPQDSAVVSLTTLAGGVTLSAGTAQRSIQGLTITGGTDGIVCSGAKLHVTSCVIAGHLDCGVEVSEESTLSLNHCIVAGNRGAGLHSLPKTTGRGLSKYSRVDLTQCTIVQNRGYGLEGDGITVANSILYGNGISAGDVQTRGNNVQVSCSDVQAGFGGQGNIDVNPLFVTPGTWTDPNAYVLGDLHLKSKAGHWNPRTCTWVLDDATSPCIDAGDPNAAFNLEPMPNGGWVNLGAYGNTTEASKSTSAFND
jgi:hypothetical protein